MSERVAQDAIGAVKQLCAALTADNASVEDVATGLGATLAVFKTARLVPAVGTNEISYAELSLGQPGTLSVRDLQAAFGAYTSVPRLHPNQPSRVLFSVEDSGLSHTCAIIAEVEPGDGGLENGQVTGVTVRRDIRLS
jgi:hypothetical protein